MIPVWSAFKALGAGRKLFMILAMAGAIIAVIAAAKHFIDGNNHAQRDLGAAAVRTRALATTLERTETANDAAEEIATDPDAARRNCLRHSRTPNNC